MDTATTSSPLQTRGTTRACSSSLAKRSMARTGPTQDSNTGKGDGRGALAELLQHDQRFDVAEPEAAVFRGDVDAEKAHLRVLVQQLVRRRLARALDLGGERRQALAAHSCGRRCCSASCSSVSLKSMSSPRRAR